jgi:hypothetical protein
MAVTKSGIIDNMTTISLHLNPFHECGIELALIPLSAACDTSECWDIKAKVNFRESEKFLWADATRGTTFLQYNLA